MGPDYGARYASEEWKLCEEGCVARTIDRIEGLCGRLAGLRVLDLGGGPGQYTVGFALRGARVTWHDPSRTYMRIAQDHAREGGVSCEWSLGFLEAASRLQDNPFDLVFCRICWYYCISDAHFADLVLRLTKPGGAAWLDIPTADWARAQNAYSRYPARLLFALYRWTGIKSGYYFMPERGRITRILASRKSVKRLTVEYCPIGTELIWVERE